MVRRYKRRGKRSRRRSVNPVSVSRALNAARSYVYENRSFTINGVQNKVTYGVLPIVLNTKEPTTGYPNYSTIITQAGHEASAIVGTDNNYTVRVMKQVVTYKLRNLSNQPCFITLYDYIALRDQQAILGTAVYRTGGAQFLYNLATGWDVKIQSAYIDPATGTGTLCDFNDNYTSTSMTTSSSLLVPSQSVMFNRFWKLRRRAVYKMMPGDDIIWHVSAPHLDVDAHKELGAVNGNKTVVTMYRIHGAMGKQNNDDTIIGYTATDVSCELLYRAKSYRIQNVERTLQMNLPTTDTIAGTLEGPSEHSVVDHNQ